MRSEPCDLAEAGAECQLNQSGVLLPAREFGQDALGLCPLEDVLRFALPSRSCFLARTGEPDGHRPSAAAEANMAEAVRYTRSASAGVRSAAIWFSVRVMSLGVTSPTRRGPSARTMCLRLVSWKPRVFSGAPS